ncbi:MAG TPA: GH3 auxin-responsive promoter family protein [Thermoanaerobaculia bacterium]|nr:GH3 auxin-responsive promoter family protein [Thermoanaerobaculia bacterium]
MSSPLLSNMAWLLSSLPEALAFQRATDQVEATQFALLRAILSANAETDFGRRHNFSSIHSAATFQERVPLGTPEVLCEDVARATAGEGGVLTRERITHFVPTSGTTSGPKLVPFTRSLQQEMQRAISPWITDLFSHDPALLRGTAYWSISPALQTEQRSPGGIPIGFAADDEYLGGFRRHFVRSIQSVPPEVARISDVEAFRYATLYFLVADRRLSLISIWNPTFLTLLLASLSDSGPSLARDVAAGLISRPLGVDGSTAARLARAALEYRSASRAAEIERALSRSDDAERNAALWPRLRVISCWSDAMAAQPAKEVAALFPQARLQAKGLLSTEGFVSFPMSAAGGAVLAIRSHFMELRPVESSDLVLAHQLERGQRYGVVLTTGGGLYRHPTGDIIEVTGFLRSCPVIRFIGRDSHVDYFGEKLSETFVSEALAVTITSYRFAMLARDGAAAAYTLYVESATDDASLIAAARSLDIALQANIHYRYCRDLGQLEAVRLYRIERNGSASYLAACVARGQRVGEVKPLALHGAQGWSDFFEGRWVEARGELKIEKMRKT